MRSWFGATEPNAQRCACRPGKHSAASSTAHSYSWRWVPLSNPDHPAYRLLMDVDTRGERDSRGSVNSADASTSPVTQSATAEPSAEAARSSRHCSEEYRTYVRLYSA